jgi:hypothetical protein
MNAYDNYHHFDETVIPEVNSGTFSFSTPVSFNAGFGWNPDFGSVSNIINPSVVVDFVGLNRICSDFSASQLFSSIKAGIEIELIKSFEFRAGLNQGYATFGLGLNLFNILHLEASYYRHEFGAMLGDNKVDALTIRFNAICEE